MMKYVGLRGEYWVELRRRSAPELRDQIVEPSPLLDAKVHINYITKILRNRLWRNLKTTRTSKFQTATPGQVFELFGTI